MGPTEVVAGPGVVPDAVVLLAADGRVLERLVGRGRLLRAVDLDRDGVEELLLLGPLDGRAALSAYSLRARRVLWRCRLAAGPVPGATTVGHGDVDGDGIEDVVLATGTRSYCISGRTGRRYWSARTEADVRSAAVASPLAAGRALVALACEDERVYLLGGRDGRLWVRVPGLHVVGRGRWLLIVGRMGEVAGW